MNDVETEAMGRPHPMLVALIGGCCLIGVLIGRLLFPAIHPIISLSIPLFLITVAFFVWITQIELPLNEKQAKHDAYPRSYTRTREYRGYRIVVEVTETKTDNSAQRRLKRTVTATAFDDGDEIATEQSTAHAGVIPQTVFDSPVGDDGNGVPAGDQTRQVLEQLYDNVLAYESTGAVEDTAGVDSALDVVFEGVER